jgi:hypothetical protein
VQVCATDEKNEENFQTAQDRSILLAIVDGQISRSSALILMKDIHWAGYTASPPLQRPQQMRKH